MANEAAQKTAPYASYRSFENFLTHLRDHQPIPSRIDKSAMSHLNYATQQALISTLRLLGLINSEDAPTQRLERLVAASDLERTPIMLDVVREGYPYFFNSQFDLARATPDQFSETMKKERNVGGATVGKAISFFIAAAEAGGLKLSPHLKKRKTRSPSVSNTNATPASPGTTTTKRRGKRVRDRAKNVSQSQQNSGSESNSIPEQLLGKFPAFDPSWPVDIQKKWFDGFDRLMTSAGVKEKDDKVPS